MPEQNTQSQETVPNNRKERSAKPQKKRVLNTRVQRVEPLEDTESDIDREALYAALTSFRRGDFSVRLPNSWRGLNAKIAFNCANFSFDFPW